MLVSSFLDILFGSMNTEVENKDREGCINLLHRNKITFVEKGSDKDRFCFSVRLSKAKKVKSLLDKSGIKVYSIRGEGLPFLAARYKMRLGILTGVILFVFLVWLSGNYVWQITFSGNDNIPDHIIEEQLAEVGFSVGTYIPSVDFYSLCNRFIRNTEGYSFISVNMEGTTARVEVRERSVRDESETYRASNLVAKYGGIIDSMTVYSGKNVVGREDVVKEGDLLVSGIVEKAVGFDIVRARGSVYAYVTRSFEVEVPYQRTVREYTGEKSSVRQIVFFGRAFSFGDHKVFEGYTENVDRERAVIFDRIRLPFLINTVTRSEYTDKQITLSESEAKAEAELDMARLLAEELCDSEVLEKKTEEEYTESSYKLRCELYCLTDIAYEKEIILNK